jgi:lysylphosphatidylglycerol synthetase-like protein (DUF2156 family)
MTRPWINPVIRCAFYLYFAAGMALLISDGMVSAVRYQADKRFPASFLSVVFVSIFGLLALASWDTFQRPISRRKWFLLCLLSSLGILELLFAPTHYGGAGA